MMQNAWLLPEYIEDILPVEAMLIETHRRSLLDLFQQHGYLYVIPPMLEYLESLTHGVGVDLDLATLKVVDQLSGRLMGLRADITPQVARIDAHILNQTGITRLCYAGTALRAIPDATQISRELLQIGAELYGHSGIEADIEVQALLLDALRVLGFEHIQFDMGHVAIFKELLQHFDISHEIGLSLRVALQKKDATALYRLSPSLPPSAQQAFSTLANLHGTAQDILPLAQDGLPSTPVIQQALSDISTIIAALQDKAVAVSVDLTELRGYHYHSGAVFSAYAPSCNHPLASGGRYDDIGKIFGRARPATGFSLDLRGVTRALSRRK